MTKKLFILGVLGLVSGLSTAFAAEGTYPITAATVTPLPETRFNCTFEGPAAVGKGALPLACTAFGEFVTPVPGVLGDDGGHLTIVCGNAVLYSDGVFGNIPSASTIELRSIVPHVADVSIRTLTTGIFTGPLGSVMRIDIPGTPPAILTGVCHLTLPVVGETLDEAAK